MVANDASLAVCEDRRQDCAPRPIGQLPDGRGHGASTAVPENPDCHRGDSPVAVGPMLSVAAVPGCATCRQENYVHVSPDRVQFSLRRRSPTDRARRVRHPAAFAVVKPIGSAIGCLPSGRMGRSSVECRIMGWWPVRWTTRAEDWVFAWLDPEQVPGTSAAKEAEAEKDYISVFLKSARVVNVRKGLTTFYGTVHSHIQLQHRSDGKAEFNAITTPAALKGVDAAGIDRVIQFNQRLLGPVPYVGGDFCVEIGLFSVAAADLAGPYLELIQNLSEAAGVSYVSAALPFVGPILHGMKLLTDSQDETSLEIGFSTTMVIPRLGYCVAIRAPKSKLRVGSLRLDPSDFRLLDDAGVIEEYPYLVVEVAADKQRADWSSIPDLSAAYRSVQAEYRGGRQKGVEEALTVFQRIAYTCNDLVEDDALRLVENVRRKYAQMGPAVRSETRGSAGVHVPDLNEIELYSP